MRTLMTTLIPLLLAALAGVATAYQPGVNARFASVVDSRVNAAAVSFGVGFLAFIVVACLMRSGVPSGERLAAAPWWSYTGGLLGAFFVIMAIILVPKIGSSSYLAAVVAGQLFASVVIDHYGHMGLVVREVTPVRAIGLALVLAGVGCVRLG